MSLDDYLEDAVNNTTHNRHQAIVHGAELRYIKFLTTLYTPRVKSEHDFFWELFDEHHEEYTALCKTYDKVKAQSHALRDTTIRAATVYYNMELKENE
jgi:hypothetical protein